MSREAAPDDNAQGSPQGAGPELGLGHSPSAGQRPRHRHWRSLIGLAIAMALCAPLVLAGCSEENDGQEPETGGASDPAINAALNDELMVDPDLVSQNEGNSALSGGGGAALPPENMTLDAALAARADAAEMVGGAAKLVPPPAPKRVDGKIPQSASLTAAARAAITPAGGNCAKKVRYSARWAARMPETFPVYPRGATQEAAGTDANGCKLRIVNFLTPVTVDDVLAFYNSRAAAAGYSAEHMLKDGENILSGTKGEASYVVFVRAEAKDVTGVDLITNGG